MQVLHRLAQGICFVTLRLFYDAHADGLENLPEGGCILAPNHVSYFDPPVIGGLIPDPIYYLARKTLFTGPIMGRLLPHLNCIPIDQERPDMVGLKKMIQTLREGKKVLLFPEGSRSFDGKLQPAQPGIGFVIAKTGVPVVPIRIFGGHEAWPRGKKPRPFVPMRITFGKPLKFFIPPHSKKDDYEKIGNEIMAAIAEIE